MISKYSVNSLNITNVPLIMVFEDGILNSIYSISDNDYYIDKLVVYINNVVLESDDM